MVQDALRASDAVLLMADTAANCRAARLAHALAPSLDLVAVMCQTRGSELAALLRVGVDWVMRPGDPPHMLVTVLRALRLRRAHCAADAWTEPAYRIGSWMLDDQGWCLRHDSGTSLRLTVSERAILLCLFDAPGHVASHAMLSQALVQAWQYVYARAPREPRPRGIISRLRWRGLRAGMEPPVESLRGYGYIWEI
jgi:DNA-binding response OmpR family regulator